LYKFIFAIVLLFLANSKSESGYSVADEINSDTSSQFIVDALTDIELDPDFDPSMAHIDKKNQILQLSYLSKYSSKKHLPLLNSKFQYLRPRAPPFTIV
tara:strand:+ start:7647 stop:7943 length:297 start_codon:yes stop_codon:yes gene_type:complete